jgi:ribosomal protein S1
MWEEAKKRFPVGARVRGVVDPVATGLIEIVHFRDEGRMTPDQYPPIGATVEAVVLDYLDTNRQVRMSVRPSHFRFMETTANR